MLGSDLERSSTNSNQGERTPLLTSTADNYSGKADEQNVAPDESTKASFSFRRLPRKEIFMFLSIGFVNFCACICFSLLAPFFPHEAEKKGVSKTVIGLIFSIFEFVIFLSSPVFGTFLVAIGPKFTFITGVCVCGVCAILFGLLDQCPPGNIFIVMCFLCRSVEALGCSAFITSSFALIANSFPDHVSTVFGTLETFSGLGLMIGPPIGGALYELGGYGLPFWVLGTVLLFCAAISYYLMPQQAEAVKTYEGSILTLLKSPLIFVTGFCIFAGSFSLGFMDPTLADHLSPFKLSTFLVGLVFLCGAGMYGFTAPLWGWLSDTKGFVKSLVIVGNIISCVAYILMGPSPLFPFFPYELWLIIVSLLLVGIFLGCAILPTIKCLIQGAKEIGFEENLNTYGLVSGCFNSFFSLGTFIGPTVGGLMSQHYGFDWAATLAAGLLLMAGVLMFSYTSVKLCCASGQTCSSCCYGDQYQSTYMTIDGKNAKNDPGTMVSQSQSVNEEEC
ncbi:MFS-type transporter SLC18B1-like [Gigantopelta aegis]|uniref:MFS-type transporter SLC18B1-like n=1 Tax=Gigantopelta aegis TaxID=1735272 RepID=UPI001B88CD8E|nr:MFS-type transporter SLC18B1-like [Gigantopelta aegis]